MLSSDDKFDINLVTLPIKGDAVLTELNQLREHDPLFWSKETHCWIVSGHKELTEGFSGELPLSNVHIPRSLHRVMEPDMLQARLPNAMRYMTQSVTNTDGAEHTRLRKLLLKSLNRKTVERLRPFVQSRIQFLLGNIKDGESVEFHEEISRMLPGAVILELLGIDQSYLSRLKAWADGVAAALSTFDPTHEGLDTLEVVITDMLEVLRGEIEKRRQTPTNDLISIFLNATEDGESLSEDEMLANLILLIVAGHDTTSNSLSLGLRALATEPQAWEYWRQNPDKNLSSSVELMRYTAMATSMPRIADTDFEWHGRQIKEGELVVLAIAAGNRDPKAYPNAEELDFSRENSASLTFGPGIHHCLGHLLAKLQISEFFTALTKDFEAADVVKEPEFTGILAFRGVTQLHTKFYRR